MATRPHFVCVWTVGKVLDANQSLNMLTLNVGVSRLDAQFFDAVPDYQTVADVASGRTRFGVYVKRVQGNNPFKTATDAKLADGPRCASSRSGRIDQVSATPKRRSPAATSPLSDGADVANLRKVILASGWP